MANSCQLLHRGSREIGRTERAGCGIPTDLRTSNGTALAVSKRGLGGTSHTAISSYPSIARRGPSIDVDYTEGPSTKPRPREVYAVLARSTYHPKLSRPVVLSLHFLNASGRFVNRSICVP